jgi:hypothetical protein
MIVGLMGQAGSGKDTAADHLTRNHGFIKIGLADPLKRICREVYDFSELQLWGPSDERNKPDLRYPTGRGHLTPRTALQLLGTEWGRACYENTWVDYCIRSAEQVLAGTHYYNQKNGLEARGLLRRLFTRPATGVVVSDVRFKNEILAIQKVGGIVIRLRRAGKDGNMAGGVTGHASEEEQKSIPDHMIDYALEVPEGISTFHQAIDKLMIKVPKSRMGRNLKAA